MKTSAERLIELRAELARPFRAEYAYPTSDHAKALGAYRTGCWHVVAREMNGKPATLASGAIATETEARELAEKMTQDAAQVLMSFDSI